MQEQWCGLDTWMMLVTAVQVVPARVLTSEIRLFSFAAVFASELFI